jgi:hypothetical protein
VKFFKTHANTIGGDGQTVITDICAAKRSRHHAGIPYRNMVSMQLFHIRTMCAIQSAFDDVANTPIDSYFSQ